jgi:hypothetical protein
MFAFPYDRETGISGSPFRHPGGIAARDAVGLGRGYRERTLVDVHEVHRQERTRSLKRLRWRLRGAWLWPSFVALTVVEMGLLHWLPVQGDATGWVASLLVAGCLNLIVVVVVGGLGAVALRRRRPDLPKVVADDYAGRVALGLVAGGLLLGGLVHRPVIEHRRAAFAEQSLAVRNWVALHGDAYARVHVGKADSIRLDEDLYRTCVPAPDPKRSLCLVVDTSKSPPAVRRDRSREPNSGFVPRFR